MYNIRNINYKKDTRFIPFAGPFLLGALTGGVAVSAFTPKPYYNPRPYHYPYYYY